MNKSGCKLTFRALPCLCSHLCTREQQYGQIPGLAQLQRMPPGVRKRLDVTLHTLPMQRPSTQSALVLSAHAAPGKADEECRSWTVMLASRCAALHGEWLETGMHVAALGTVQALGRLGRAK